MLQSKEFNLFLYFFKLVKILKTRYDLNELLKTLYYFLPGIGSIKIWQDFANKYNFHEEIVMSQIDEPNLISEIKNKLSYLLKESTTEINKLSAILIAKMTSSFLLSYFLNTPLYFCVDILAASTEIYFGSKKERSEEEQILELLEYFKD